jgi:diguanylate cyclase (GGDEF)-like protein
MNTSPAATPDPRTDDSFVSFAPYAQLVKMLVPSSGCIAVYDSDGDLMWCTDGFERPDFRELVDELRADAHSSMGSRSGVRTSTEGVTAFASLMSDADGYTLGCVVIELSQSGQNPGQVSVVHSLLRPVLECIQNRMTLDRNAREGQPAPAADLDLLLGADEADEDGPSALQGLVQHCVDNLDCVGGAFIVPEKNFSVIVGCSTPGTPAGSRFLDQTQKHLLAWAQLNNRPMVVNRVGAQERQTPYKILSCPVRDPENRVTGLLALFRAADAANFEIRDIRILEFMSRKAVGIMNSQHDSLTGLINRRIFERRAQRHLDSASSSEPAFLYIDIDQIQLINESFGYGAGDEVIKRLAEVLRSELRDDEFATRFGGDRFAVFLPADDAGRAQTLAAAVLSAMSRLGYVNGGETVPVSVSIGLAQPSAPSGDVRHLAAAAELACKRAKEQGRNRLEISSESSLVTVARRNELFASASLRQALQNNEFRLEAQPIVQLTPVGGEILGFEILVRMRDPSGQLVAPDKFRHAAERYGLMPALDKWVVTATIRALKDSGARLEELPMGISINLAAQTLQSESFPRLAVQEIRESGLNPESFCFEISESAASHHIALSQHFIDTFAAAGCHVALDNFGHALTSLAHLKRLRVRYLKIDGSLTRRVLDDIHVESMMGGLARAAQTLGVKTVAEHVESREIASKLRDLEIDLGQGFHFGRPEPLLRVLERLASPSRAAATVP